MDINEQYYEEFMSVTAVNLTYNGKNSPTSTHNSVVRKWWDELPT